MTFFSCSSYQLTNSNLNTEVSFEENKNHTKDLELEIKRDYFLWGSVPSSRKIDVSKELNSRGVTKLSSLEFQKIGNSSDTLWSILSLGFYSPETYLISGKSTIK
jgi:hypothetical protein